MQLTSGTRRYSLTELAIYIAMIAVTLGVMRGFFVSIDSLKQSERAGDTSVLSIETGTPFNVLLVFGVLVASSMLGALVACGFSVLITGHRWAKRIVVSGTALGLIGGSIAVCSRF